jgi:hypothetical protein
VKAEAISLEQGAWTLVSLKSEADAVFAGTPDTRHLPCQADFRAASVLILELDGRLVTALLAHTFERITGRHPHGE